MRDRHSYPPVAFLDSAPTRKAVFHALAGRACATSPRSMNLARGYVDHLVQANDVGPCSTSSPATIPVEDRMRSLARFGVYIDANKDGITTPASTSSTYHPNLQYTLFTHL